MRYKKTALSVISLIVLLVLILSLQPLLIKAVIAKYKSTDHFLTLQEEPRIRYEESALENAVIFNDIFTESITTVERKLNLTFNGEIEVLICNTQESFNSYIYLSKNVRGAAFWGKVFLSPGAFNRGSLLALTRHELTHHLFYTYLGDKAHIENIPLWFREGIAVYVASEGEELSMARLQVNRRLVTSLLNGEFNTWFSSSNPLGALNSNGNVNLAAYGIAGHFVQYLHDLQSDAFNTLLSLLSSGEKFNDAIQSSYNKDIADLLSDFTDSLR